METVIISSDYQIEIPTSIREDLDIQPGEPLQIYQKNGVIRLIKVGNIKDMRGKYPNISSNEIRDKTERFVD